MSIPFTPETLSRLQRLLQEREFAEEDCYPGATTEDIRVECERRVNQLLDRVITLLQQGATKEIFIAQASELEASFRHDDTEEREKIGDYIGETMRIIGVKYWDPQWGEDPEERDKYFGFKSK
jgi:Domain of unknown function (DUF4844)